MPNVKHAAVSNISIVLARSKAGIPFSRLDGWPIRIFLNFLSPMPSPPEYLELFVRMLTMFVNRRIRKDFQIVKTREQILHALLVN